eukprot:gene14437-15941_t
MWENEVIIIDNSEDDDSSVNSIVTSFQLMESPSKSEYQEREGESSKGCIKILFKPDEEWSGDESCKPKTDADSYSDFEEDFPP